MVNATAAGAVLVGPFGALAAGGSTDAPPPPPPPPQPAAARDTRHGSSETTIERIAPTAENSRICGCCFRASGAVRYRASHGPGNDGLGVTRSSLVLRLPAVPAAARS